MNIQRLLNEYKDSIIRFEVYEKLLVIHLKDKGKVEIECADESSNIKLSHITNQ